MTLVSRRAVADQDVVETATHVLAALPGEWEITWERPDREYVSAKRLSDGLGIGFGRVYHNRSIEVSGLLPREQDVCPSLLGDEKMPSTRFHPERLLGSIATQIIARVIEPYEPLHARQREIIDATLKGRRSGVAIYSELARLIGEPERPDMRTDLARGYHATLWPKVPGGHASIEVSPIGSVKLSVTSSDLAFVERLCVALVGREATA